MSLSRTIRSAMSSGGARLTRLGRDIVRPAQPEQPSNEINMGILNPLKLNIVLPVSKRDHIGRVKPLSQGDLVGLRFVIDGGTPIDVSFVGTAFGLDGLAQYGDLSPGNHTLQVAVMSKGGVGRLTDPAPFMVAELIDAPTITLE